MSVTAALAALKGDFSGMAPTYRILDDSELMLTIPSSPIDDREKLNRLVKGGMIPRQVGVKSGDVPINVPISAEANRDVPINAPINAPINIKVLKVIERNPGINREQLAEKLHVDVKTIGRAIASLSRKVEHRGSKKTGGYYCI